MDEKKNQNKLNEIAIKQNKIDTCAIGVRQGFFQKANKLDLFSPHPTKKRATSQEVTPFYYLLSSAMRDKRLLRTNICTLDISKNSFCSSYDSQCTTRNSNRPFFASTEC